MKILFDHIINKIKSMKINETYVKLKYSDSLESWEIQDIINKRDSDIDELCDLIYSLNSTIPTNSWSHDNELGNIYAENIEHINLKHASWLNNQAEYYFSQKNIRLDELDWLFTDLLINMTYRIFEKKTQSFKSKLLYPSLFYHLNDIFNTSKMSEDGIKKTILKMTIKTIIKLTIFLTKWLVVIGTIIYLFLNSTDNPFLGILSLIIISHLLFVRFYNVHFSKVLEYKFEKNLDLIRRVYSLTESTKIHWDILEKEIEKTREKGISWPSSIYTASKSNLQK